MPLITGRSRVLEVFARASERGWVLPAFNSENLTCTEAILAAAYEYATEFGERDLPITISTTNRYWHRAQSTEYTHTRDWRLGLRLFMEDLKVLTSSGSPFAGLNVLVHLDHIQWDADEELLLWDLTRFSSIMYDASTRPIDENIRLTGSFVEKHGRDLVIEGACDEIGEAAESKPEPMTSPDAVDRYFRQTGVDIVVANLGTEHRASAAALKYHGELAREICSRIGHRICLHGTSSVPKEQLAGLYQDGVCKVNIWTALERDSSPALLYDLLKNAGKVVGSRRAQEWAAEGILGPSADQTSASQLPYFATSHRQGVVFREMKRVVTEFLRLWYR